MVEDAAPVLRLIADVIFIAKIKTSAAVTRHVARTKLFPCLIQVCPVSLRGQRWLRSFDELSWLNLDACQPNVRVVCECASVRVCECANVQVRERMSV